MKNWVLAPVVKALMALRGIKLITAMTIMAELGDITQFDSPPQLMSFLGVPNSMCIHNSQNSNSLLNINSKSLHKHPPTIKILFHAWVYQLKPNDELIMQ